MVGTKYLQDKWPDDGGPINAFEDIVNGNARDAADRRNYLKNAAMVTQAAIKAGQAKAAAKAAAIKRSRMYRDMAFLALGAGCVLLCGIWPYWIGVVTLVASAYLLTCSVRAKNGGDTNA